MAHTGHTLQVITLSGLMSLTPLTWGEDDMPNGFTYGQEIAGSRQILEQPSDDGSNAYRRHSERQATHGKKVQRSDLGRVLLQALFPEKIIRMKKLDADSSSSRPAPAAARARIQYQVGLAFQGATLKLRSQDDLLGVSLGNSANDDDARYIKLGVKLRW